MADRFFTAYERVLDALYNSYQKQGDRVIKKMSLVKIKALCKALGHPERKFLCIHVAGTNGKGSTSHALGSVLQVAGYKTGLYTSPHIKNFTERIRVDGEEIGEGYVVDFFDSKQKIFDELQPSFFEMSVALAFFYFAECKVDIAVIEVGLGGRLDATNVVVPVVSVITNISLDHTGVLGSTLAGIAYEKAGIMKWKVPVVIGDYEAESMSVFEAVAQREHAPIIQAWERYDVEFIGGDDNGLWVDIREEGILWLRSLRVELAGMYQLKNLRGIVGTLRILSQKGFAITERDIRAGLGAIKRLTGFRGRWQVLSYEPKTVVDVAHNKGGIKEVIGQLNTMFYSRLHIVLGLMKKPEEEVKGMLSILPRRAYYYFVQANTARSMRASSLATYADSLGLSGNAYSCVRVGLGEAKKSISDEKSDIILVTGSIYVIGELL